MLDTVLDFARRSWACAFWPEDTEKGRMGYCGKCGAHAGYHVGGVYSKPPVPAPLIDEQIREALEES